MDNSAGVTAPVAGGQASQALSGGDSSPPTNANPGAISPAPDVQQQKIPLPQAAQEALGKQIAIARQKYAAQLQAANARSSQLQQEIEGLRAQQRSVPPMATHDAQPSGDAPANQLDSVLSGLHNDDLITAAELRQAFSQFSKHVKPPETNIQETLTPIQQRMAHLEAQARDPDYLKTINTHLPGLITNNPSLGPMLQNHPTPLIAALELIKLSRGGSLPGEGGAQPTADNNDPLSEFERLFTAISAPASPGAVGGGGGGGNTRDYANMGDAQFRELFNAVKTGKGF